MTESEPAGSTRATGSLRLHLLTSSDLDAADPASLPYRWDHLRSHGWELAWTSRHLHRPWVSRPLGPAVAAVERAGAPLLQTLLSTKSIGHSDAVLAMFESEGNIAAALRSAAVWPFRTTALGVVSCWLAELLPRMSSRRRAMYRKAYAGVDRLYYFSDNQTPVFEEHLGLDRSVLRPIRFGIDVDELEGIEVSDRGYVAAIGRDRGRDWPTFAAAVRGTGLDVKLACRESDRATLDLPSEVEYLGYLGRERYLQVLAGAAVVAIPSYVRAYPSGQTVALEAMALGKCVVLTDTPAWKGYADVDRALLVPPNDAEQLRHALVTAMTDHELRRRRGEVARSVAKERFGAAAMWASVAEDLRAAVGARR